MSATQSQISRIAICNVTQPLQNAKHTDVQIEDERIQRKVENPSCVGCTGIRQLLVDRLRRTLLNGYLGLPMQRKKQASLEMRLTPKIDAEYILALEKLPIEISDPPPSTGNAGRSESELVWTLNLGSTLLIAPPHCLAPPTPRRDWPVMVKLPFPKARRIFRIEEGSTWSL
ncbi:hypothetical protein TWF694_008137 [Orbilia ellipsospora]|uniref:Uncharacterized protein n=1 Tax=Orbilia ellipsospora TaxID=2528407 RepID=A0AAV9XGG0_9PEZI